MRIIKKKCPLCGKIHYMKITEKEYAEYVLYICYGGPIQERIHMNQFCREFIKTGYCPKCQERLFDRKNEENPELFFYEDQLDTTAIKAFIQKSSGLSRIQAITSVHADMLGINEKQVYLHEFELEEFFAIREDGSVIPVKSE